MTVPIQALSLQTRTGLLTEPLQLTIRDNSQFAHDDCRMRRIVGSHHQI